MQTLRLISQIMLSVSMLSALLAAVIFFRFRIKDVYAELSGKSATDEIARLREQGLVRQSRGRSLESIMGNQNLADSGSFDLARLGIYQHGSIQSANAGYQSEPVTTFLQHEAVNEPLTEMLGQTGPVEPLTELLAPPISQEPMTELLSPGNTDEPLTEFLNPG
ncbi:MAG: hypothetical protein FWH40_01845 [Coriobacteriia bacterium]|nr:hypothetical protein [Coriobacteriia bacterium]